MRYVWLLVFLVLLGSVFAPSPARSYVPDNALSPFGVVERTGYEDFVALGGHWMRQDEVSYRFEPAPGEWVWTWDTEIDTCEMLGLNFSPDISIGQCWLSGFAGEFHDPSYPPIDLSTTWNPAFGYSQLYYDLIYGIIDHYRGRFHQIAIEAECNSHFAGTADEYIRMLKTAYLAAHRADPTMQVMDSGMASEAWGAVIAKERITSGLYTQQQILDFVNAYYDRSVYFPLFFTSYTDLVNWINSPFVSGQIARVNYILDHMGGAIDGMNLKFTEYWWLYADVLDYIDRRTAAAGYSPPFKINNEESVWPGGSETQYGKELVCQFVEGMRLGIDRFHWFPLSNQITSTPRVGLIDSLGVVRQTGQAFRYASHVIGPNFAFDHLDLSAPNVRQYVFEHRGDPAHHLRVCWYDNGTHQAGFSLVRFYLPTNTTRVVKSDHLGHRTIAELTGDPYIDITINENPTYVEYFQNLSVVTSVPEAGATPEARATAALQQNFPNPFRPTTTIRFTVPGALGETREAHLTVFDTRGRAVRHLVAGPTAAGDHDAYWSGETDQGESLPPGIYLYRLDCGDFRDTRKMILAR